MNQKLTVPQSSSILAKITQHKETKKRLFKYAWEEFENDFLAIYHFGPSWTILFLNLTDMISWILFSSLFRLVFDSL